MNTHFKLKCSAAILCAMAFLAYGQMSAGLSDKQVIEKAVLLLRHYDTTVLDINRLMTAKWHQNGGYAVIYSLEDDESKPIDVYIVLSFTDPPYESYTQGGPDSRIVERFMAQINKKLSNNIPLINFIRKDLIVTLEYADGSKIIFDAYYTDIRKNLPFWRKEFDPKTGPMFRYYSD